MPGSGTQLGIEDLPDFWPLVERADHAILLLDYDGTLAPFHADRMKARPLEGVLPALDQLSALANTTVALISGRPVEEIQQLTGLDSLIIAGTHGFELYRPGQGIQRRLPSNELSDRLDLIETVAEQIVGPELAERKIATVALHTRKLEPEAAAYSQRAFRRDIGPHMTSELEARDFDGGVEVRVCGRDKGAAVLEILEELQPADLVVYIGDDDTDEDAFKALDGKGVGIKVGSQDRPTAAAGRLSTCDDVLQLLNDWIEARPC